MGSEICLKLPVIDFSNFEGNWKSVKSQVYEAVTEYGCFEANVFDDKVPLELRKAIFGALEELFDLPLEIKKLNVCKLRFHGYVGNPNPMISLYEAMGIDDADDFDKVNHMTNILWPQGNPSFRKRRNGDTRTPLGYPISVGFGFGVILFIPARN
ncbi:putative 2-oxoglutarate-dependent dioxygenase AOP1 [Trifolium repens]|nr:putative 2-oxoglutarate-dependent dioxygenase AOP1 [Trifolium repens]